ncbi:MAG: isochorismatase family protein [Ginsengibacter sp.]
MSSYPIRDPKSDHLLTPQNAALLIIDYQPIQVNSINSTLRKTMAENMTTVAKLVMSFKMPVVLSTINVNTGMNKETISILKDVLPGIPSYDRTTVNAWEDKEFNEAVKNTGRQKLIIAALWSEVCMAFPTLDALKDGYDVYPVVDAIGGTSVIAHEMALRRVEQAGAKLISTSQLACELQRDWARHETVDYMVKALISTGAFFDV